MALAEYQGSLLAAGLFSLADSTRVSGVAHWSGTRWEPFGACAGDKCEGLGGGGIFCMIEYGGDLIVAGNFSSIDGVEASNIARWDGLAWHPLGTGIQSVSSPLETYISVDRMAVYHGELIVLGEFSQAGEINTCSLARWNGVTWSSLGKVGFGDFGAALAVYGDELIVGGYNFFVDGTAGYGLAAWNGTHWRKVLDDASKWYVWSLYVDGGDLIVGGSNFSFDGTPLQGLGRFDGTTWHDMGTGVDPSLSSALFARVFAHYQGTLIAAGGFPHVDGVPECNIAQWDGARWHALGRGTGLTSGDAQDVAALLEYEGELIAGGSFSSADGAAVGNIARWNGTSWQGLGVDGLGVTDVVADFQPYQARLVASGYFKQAGASNAHYVAQWTGSAWEAMDAGLPADSIGVRALTGNGDALYGVLETGLGIWDRETHAVVRWDGAQWSRLGGGMNHEVNCLSMYHGDVVAAGAFTEIGTTAASRIARWDGSTWVPLGDGLNSVVNAVGVYRDELIAAGHFTTAGGAPANCIAKWDGSTWSPLGDGIGGTSPQVLGLAADGDVLYAVGSFDRAGAQPATGVAAWDGRSWRALGNSLAPRHPHAPLVSGVAVLDGALYIAGYFDRDGTTSLGHVARWSGAQWLPLGSGISACLDEWYWGRFVLESFQDQLWVGGAFAAAGGKPSRFVARWSAPQVAVQVADFAARTTGGEVHLSWKLSATASSELGGVFVERAVAEAGPYVRCNAAALTPAPVMEFIDTVPTHGPNCWYRLALAHRDGTMSFTRPLAVQLDAALTIRTALEPPYEAVDGPVQIRYSLANAEPAVRLAVYDARGRQVWASAREAHPAGRYTRTWDRLDARGVRVPRGVYFLRLETSGTSPARKLVLAKP